DEIDQVLPGIGEAFKGMTAQMQFAMETLSTLWDIFVSKIEKGAAVFTKVAGFVKGIFGGGSDVTVPPIPSDIQAAQAQNMANVQRGNAI
ncbi:hypothetical protein, partial [Bacillus cereus]|uniref:hypothetical protein n=1 Tax=Bacillus cereus TaxID=1396 RepID=UPI0019669CB0